MFEMHIKTDNAAFADGAGFEIARILRGLADKIEHETAPFEIILLDFNGNRVGKASLVDEE